MCARDFFSPAGVNGLGLFMFHGLGVIFDDKSPDHCGPLRLPLRQGHELADQTNSLGR
jgi:hypothetical protein